MKRLVINADDFGLAPGVSRGIVEAMTRGVVTSTSCMVFDRPPVIPEEIRGRVGLHLQYENGPVAGISAEFAKQAIVFIRDAGFPTHIDTHHHVHRFPEAFASYSKLAKALGCAAVGMDAAQVSALRADGVRCPDAIALNWDHARLFEQHDTVWLMTHPGYVDDDLRAVSTWTDRRENELKTLLSPEFRQSLAAGGIQLIGAADL